MGVRRRRRRAPRASHQVEGRVLCPHDIRAGGWNVEQQGGKSGYRTEDRRGGPLALEGAVFRNHYVAPVSLVGMCVLVKRVCA